MAHHSMPPPTHDWYPPDQFGTFDAFHTKTELWLVGEGVDPILQYNKIVLMLGDIGLKKWKKFNMPEEDRKDQVKAFKRFRESLGNDISFYTARSTLYRNVLQGTNETIHEQT